MKKIHLLFYVLFSAIFFSSCNHGGKAGSDEIIINGKLKYNGEDLIYLQQLNPTDVITIDSMKLGKDGTFSFKRKTKETNFYFLKIADTDFITLLVEPGESVAVEADASQLSKNYKISGSVGSQLLLELNDRLNVLYGKVDTLGRKFKEIQGKPDFLAQKAILDSAYNKLFFGHKKYLEQFIAQHESSLAVIIALYQNLGRRPMLTIKDDMPVFEKAAQKLISVYPDNPHVVALKKRITELKQKEADLKTAKQRIVTDSVAPAFAMRDTAGKNISLASLSGKAVLIYFTSASCISCINENPELIKIYRKYRPKGFEVLAVYIDKSMKDWRASIASGKIPWLCVSDLSSWESPVVKLYGVDKLPYLILVGKDGRIAVPDISIKTVESRLLPLLKKPTV